VVLRRKSILRGVVEDFRTINYLQQLNQEVKRGTRLVCVFPNKASHLRLVSAILMRIGEEWERQNVMKIRNRLGLYPKGFQWSLCSALQKIFCITIAPMFFNCMTYGDETLSFSSPMVFLKTHGCT